ncbi:MAG: FtsX-like permease family protein [Boseongicola sp.]
MNRVVLGTLISHWKRRPIQLFTLIVGLALATALWSGVQAINAEARQSYSQAAGILGGNSAIVLKGNAPISEAIYSKLRRSGWLVSPIIEGRILSDRGRVRVLGIDPLTMPPNSFAGDTMKNIEITDFLGADGILLAAPNTASRLSAYANRIRIVDGMVPGTVLADLAAAKLLLNSSGYTRLLLSKIQPLQQPKLAEISPELEIQSPETAADLSRLTDSFHLNLTAFGLLSFVVGLFIVNGAVGLAFEQRRYTFRTLRTIGVSSRQLILVLIVELLAFALIAGALGIALGYGIAAALLPDVAATLRGLYGASVEGTLTLSPIWWLSGFAIAVLGTGLASATSLFKVARLSPLATAHPRAWERASATTMRRQSLIALICLAIATGVWGFGQGLVAGFVLLGGLLLGAALLLPAVLTVFLNLARERAVGPIAQWFWADTQHQLPSLSLAMMALLLALSANIGVSTMVGSFRHTFTAYLDQRLVSELYVSVEDETDIPAFLSFVEPRVDAVLPIWKTESDVLGAPAEIYGVVDHSSYRENWPILDASPDVWENLANGVGALINEQLARRESMSVGDDLPMPGGWTTQVGGIYSDYGNPIGQVILPISVLTEQYSNVDRKDFGLRLAKSEVGTLRMALIDDFGLPPNNMVDQASLKDFSLSVFERTFSVTGALNVLTLGIAGIAILTSLLTLAAMRLPQVAPVWAIGVTRRTLSRIELARAMILATLTFVLALPVGLALAWVLLSVINVEAFGWRLPLHIFPLELARLFLLSLLAAGLAAIWPAHRLSNRPPSDLIRVFAHER